MRESVSFAHILLVSLAALPVLSGQPAGPEQTEFFEKRVRPLLAARCHACHDAARHTAGLDLTSAAGLRKGADSGPVVVPGEIENSRLIRVVGYQERIKMPPGGRLKDEEIAVLREWVRLGAPWPGPQAGSAGGPKQGYSRAQREFWSFRPLKPVVPPRVKDEAWARAPIDRFILARLEDAGLRPAPPADKTTLIRRATLDLTGLPPSEQEVRAFLADTSRFAFEKVVDRLLASPRYGERWGRHWLDVARYADSTGADEDHRYPYAWRYRDYVIDAFNRDLPYDRFMREQIAGDLLPATDGNQVNTTGIVATGFLALGPKLIAEQDKIKMFYDIVDEQIDVAGKAFLGLTLACARCHDHKFDPISTRDYYSLASIFASTRQLAKLEGTVSKLYFAPLVAKEVADRYEAHQKKIEDKQREIDDLNRKEAARYRDTLAPRLAEYMLAARKVYEGGATAPDVARERSLDADVLSRWVEYLKPNKERRVHLEPWYRSSPAEGEPAARRYQEEFMAVASERNRAQKEWEAKAETARKSGQEPPQPPNFQPGDNRFFTEVSTAKGPFALPAKDKEKVFSESGRARAEILKVELKRLKDSAPPEPPLACGVAEGKSVDQRIFVRGNPEAPGEPAPKRFPIVLAGEDQPPIREGSGRRELARWLSDPGNPLPARVMVNRIWQGHFGQGLVRTPSNFGVTGERPTHQELLDWLAAEFIAHGWSVKAMHRMLMLSGSYQMSSETSPAKLEKDADNRLLSRFPRRRMSIEEIRDSLLTLDGTLDLSMGGTLQTGQGTDKEFSDDRKSLSPAASKRRTVYLPLRRSNLPSLFTLFDFGDATTSNETRTQTNVAPQALFMMNSGFVDERTHALAGQLLRSEPDDARRVERAFFAVLSRRPEPEEATGALRYIQGFPPGRDGAPAAAWASWCRTLVASNDFIYVH